MTQSIEQQRMAERVAGLRRQMAQAAREAGRTPEDILLCAACKSHGSDIVRQSAALPIDLFGENRMQELLVHLADDAFLGKPCHFIGHLQTNKVRRVVGQVEMIQSVNSHRLLSAIAKAAENQQIVQDILFEINIGEEETKTGAGREELWPLFDAAGELPSVRVRGLMAIPPAFDNSAKSRRYFAQMRFLLEFSQMRYPGMKHLDTLSMGMTDSFIAAIQEGATLIRVGTAIYGARSQ